MQWKYLVRKPGSNYKQLFVKDRWVAAWDLYCATFASDREPDESPAMTPEEIAENFYVPLEAVKEAVAYCESNPPELQQDFEADERLAKATGMNDPNYVLLGTRKYLTPEERAQLFQE